MRALRRVAHYAVALLLASCAAESTSVQRVQPHPGDPAIDGVSGLLSEQDFRAVLAVARRRVAAMGLPCAVSSVSVLSADKIEAHFCQNDQAYLMWSGTLTLRKINGEWKVTELRGGRPPRPEEVFI